MSEPCAERPDAACVLCRPPREGRPWRLADAGYVTCTPCADRLRELLQDILDRTSHLDPGARGVTGETMRGAPGFGSRSPAVDHVIVFLDARSSQDAKTWRGADGKLHRESEHPPLSVFGVLDTVAWEIADERGVEGPKQPGVAGRVDFIDRQLDWLTQQRWVVETASTLRRLRGQLKPYTGDPRIKIGSCPNTIDEGETTRVCKAPLYAPATRGEDDSINCPACHRHWPWDEWTKLGELLDAS